MSDDRDPKELGYDATSLDAVASTVSAENADADAANVPVVGTVLAKRYKLLEELGRGAHGAVFKAHDRHADEEVALKIVFRRKGEDLALVRRELAVARKVTHPGVVRLHDLVEIEGGWALSMELVEGSSLEDEIGRGPLAPKRLVAVARALADALAALHAAGVTHRDLKPGNILVRPGGRIVVSDFGISRLHMGHHAAEGDAPAQPGIALTRRGAIIGTPLYMAPEQLEGSPLVGPPADIYAFGLILCEAATGEPPGEDATSFDELLARRESTVPEPPEALPPRLRTVVARCLEPDAADRYRDGAALFEALEGRPHDLLIKSASPLTLTRARRTRRVVAGSVAAGLALVAGALWALRPAKSTAEAGRLALPAPAPVAIVAQRVRRATFGDSCDEYPSFYPDGKSIVFDRTEGTKSHLYRLDLASQQPTALTQSPGWDIAATVSPSGDSIAFLRRDDKLTAAHLLDLASGEIRMLLPGRLRPVFSADGTSLWAGQVERPVRVTIADGKVAEELTLPEGHFAIRVVPLGGDRVAGVLRVVDQSERGGLAFGVPGAGGTSWRWIVESTPAEGTFQDALGLDRTRGLLFASRRRQYRRVELVTVSAQSGEARPAPGAGVDAYTGIDVSADGRQVVWSTCNARASFAIASKDKLEVLMQDSAWSTAEAIVLPDDRVVLLSDRDGVSDKLWLGGLRTPSSELSELSTPGVPSFVAASADGSRIVASTDQGIVVIDMAQPRTTHAITDGKFDMRPSFDWQGRIVFTRPDEQAHTRVFRTALGGGAPEQLPIVVDAVDAVASPVADLVVYLVNGPDGGLPMKLDEKGPRPLSPALERAAYFWPAFSPDGATVTLIRGSHEVVFVDVATERVTKILSLDADDLGRTQLMPSGELYVINRRWTGSIFIADLDPAGSAPHH